ncbi:MAG TPA: DUF11 domain-containing protein [Chloroflexi bacterium]|nr:DUF11 domain-containing protein [Chloroflexota bacterium]
MIKGIHMALASRRERLRYGLGAVCIGLAALLLLLSFRGGAAQGLAAPLAPTITKGSATSIVDTNNTLNQAVAGELVTITVVYNVPAGETLYDASLRVVLPDGIFPYDSDPSWAAMYTGVRNTLRITEELASQNGALVVFPLESGPVAGPQVFTHTISARLLRDRYVAGSLINHNTNLDTQVVLRWCSDLACTLPQVLQSPTNVTTARVTAIQPLVDPVCEEMYLDSAGLGAGGGQVRLTFAGYPDNRPTAYEAVFTATVGAGLTYNASNGGVDSPGSGGSTYVVWNKASLPAGDTWQPVITATLPVTFTIGREFTCQGMATYETFAGDVPYEGKYTTSDAGKTLRPGLSTVTKTSLPSDAVTMGDRVTYTVVFRQAANTLLQSPQVVDTQPLGFHYISDTFALENATLITFVTEAGGTGNVYQNLNWVMDNLPPTGLRVITATYTVLNTGLNYDGDPVWSTVADMRAARESTSNVTGAVLSWTPPAGSPYDSAARVNAALRVIQPYMGDNFSTSRTDAGDREIGQSVNLTIRFHNLGALSSGKSIPAHELEVCDTLPMGLVFSQNNGCFVSGTTTVCPFAYTTPSIGDEGTVCWQIPALPRTTTYYELRYQAGIGPAAFPGVHTNEAHVTTYSSQPGVVEGERVYDEFPEALPSANCGATCMTILGLEGNKMPWQTTVAPGDFLTYTLLFTDTGSATYTGLLVTDTYDSLLSFVGATPAPVHDPGTRTLTWNLGAVPAGGNQQIILTMRVAGEVAGRYALTNTMTWDSDQTTPHTLSKVTEIDVASLHVGMSGSPFTHAGGEVVYTVTYSNTGSSSMAPITLTLDYDSHLTYVSATLTPVDAENRVFADTVPNDGDNKMLTITLSANAPLPYTLEEITSEVALTSPGAPAQTGGWTTTLQRPVFKFHKTGPPVAETTMQYQFELVNTGDYTATNLVITDTWDTATSFQTSPGWTLAGSGTYANYTIPSLAPGATATINPLTVKVDVLQDSYLNQADLSSDQTAGQQTELLVWAHSIALSKTAYPTPAFPGRVLTYTLYYTNTGIGIVNAVITDTLDPGFDFLGQSTAQAPDCQSPGWSFTYTDHKAVWTCASLLNGASGHFIITGEVTAVEGTQLVNEAVSKGSDQPLRPLDEPLYTLVARPWLRIDKAVAPTYPVAPGDRVTYTLTYENYGSYAAYDVIVKDQLPTQLTFLGCDPACTHGAGLVSWTIGELPVAAGGELVVYATVKAGTGGQTAKNENYTIENTTIWQRLLPTETDQGAAVDTVILNPQLTLTKVATPAVVQAVNDTIVYTITYANTGGGLLHDVEITDDLDIRTGFTAASDGCNHTGGAAGGTVTCQLGDLPNGESREVVVSVAVLTGSAGDMILNEAQGRTTEAPLTSSNITTVWYQEIRYPEIALTPASFTKSADEGSTTVLQDTLTVSNTGDANLLWSVAVMTPTEATWLKVAVGGGDPGTAILPQVTAPGASTPVTVYFDPTGLAPGAYNAWLRIVSNDADDSEVLVPVTFTIRAPGDDYYIYLPLVLKSYQ